MIRVIFHLNERSNSIDRPIDIDIGDLSGCDWERIEWISQKCGLHQGPSIPGEALRVRPVLWWCHVCGAGPLGDRSLPRRSLGYIYGGFPLIPPYRCTSEVRRFLRKRHVCGASSLGDRSLPRRSLGYTCRPLSTPSNGIIKSASGGFPRGRAWIGF